VDGRKSLAAQLIHDFVTEIEKTYPTNVNTRAIQVISIRTTVSPSYALRRPITDEAGI